MICKLGSHIDTMVYQMSPCLVLSQKELHLLTTVSLHRRQLSRRTSSHCCCLWRWSEINKQQTWDTDTAQEIQQSCRWWYSNDCIHSDTVTFWTTYKFRKSIILSVICFRTTIIFMCPNTLKVNMCLIILHVWIPTVAMVFINSANRNVLYLSLFVWCLGS